MLEIRLWALKVSKKKTMSDLFQRKEVFIPMLLVSSNDTNTLQIHSSGENLKCSCVFRGWKNLSTGYRNTCYWREYEKKNVSRHDTVIIRQDGLVFSFDLVWTSEASAKLMKIRAVYFRYKLSRPMGNVHGWSESTPSRNKLQLWRKYYTKSECISQICC